MIERKHLRIVRAVQRVVAAAKDLADAERALKRPHKKAMIEQDKSPAEVAAEKIWREIPAYLRHILDRDADVPYFAKIITKAYAGAACTRCADLQAHLRTAKHDALMEAAGLLSLCHEDRATELIGRIRNLAAAALKGEKL